MSNAAPHVAPGAHDVSAPPALGGVLTYEIVTPSARVAQGTCHSIVAPAVLGEVGILPGHTPYLAVLDIGVLKISGAAAGEPGLRIFVAGGFLEVLADKVLVLAETAERSEQVDVARSTASRDRARQRLAHVDGPPSAGVPLDRLRARRALRRAEARLNTVQAAASSPAAASSHA